MPSFFSFFLFFFFALYLFMFVFFCVIGSLVSLFFSDLFRVVLETNTCFYIIFVVVDVGLFFIHILPPEKKTREIYYYFCLLFRLIFRLFFSFVFASLGAGVHSLHHIHRTSFSHSISFRFSVDVPNVRNERMTIILLLVTCLLCCSFVHRAQFALFVRRLLYCSKTFALSLTPFPLSNSEMQSLFDVVLRI